jgi:hypothetical protein
MRKSSRSTDGESNRRAVEVLIRVIIMSYLVGKLVFLATNIRQAPYANPSTHKHNNERGEVVMKSLTFKRRSADRFS